MSTEIDKFAQLDDQPVSGGGDDYEAPRETAAPPDAGQYTFMRVDEADDDTRQGRSIAKDGQGLAWFQFKLAIVGGPFDGRFVFDGCNTYVGQYRPSSSAADFLHACGSSLRPTTIKTYEEAVLATYGPFNAVIDWEWRCRDCEETFLTGAKSPKKAKKFKGPIKPVQRTKTGTVDYEQVCPLCAQKVAAQAKIKRYVVPSSTNGTSSSASTTTATAMPPAEG